MVIGANPAAAHPVFNSRMKQALRRGAKLIVVDPRVTETVKSAHVEADYHLQLLPGTNVAVINALAHLVHKGHGISCRVQNQTYLEYANQVLVEELRPIFY